MVLGFVLPNVGPINKLNMLNHLCLINRSQRLAVFVASTAFQQTIGCFYNICGFCGVCGGQSTFTVSIELEVLFEIVALK